MKRVIAPLSIAALLLLPSVGGTLAGQPGTNAGVNCGTAGATMTPGNSGSPTVKGSPFAGGTSGTVYANAFNGSGSQSPNAPVQATSQYDIACKNVTAHQPP
jgi:hypothetical protein